MKTRPASFAVQCLESAHRLPTPPCLLASVLPLLGLIALTASCRPARTQGPIIRGTACRRPNLNHALYNVSQSVRPFDARPNARDQKPESLLPPYPRQPARRCMISVSLASVHRPRRDFIIPVPRSGVRMSRYVHRPTPQAPARAHITFPSATTRHATMPPSLQTLLRRASPGPPSSVSLSSHTPGHRTACGFPLLVYRFSCLVCWCATSFVPPARPLCVRPTRTASQYPLSIARRLSSQVAASSAGSHSSPPGPEA